MIDDREPDNSKNSTDPPDNQRKEDEVSLESSGDESKATDPPDNQ
jgi:hypothetical protein